MPEEIISFSLLCLTSVFFIVNPVGAVPVFLALTDGADHAVRLRVIRRSVLVAGVVLLVFAITGNLIFKLFGFSLGAFRVAGGILLLLMAIDMLHGRPSHTKTTPEDQLEAQAKEELGTSPIGVPQLAGPGAIATVILLPGDPRVWWKIIPVVFSVLVTLTSTYFILRGAEKVQKYIGQSGSRILTKIMGLLIGGVAIQFIAVGIGDLLPLMMQKLR